MSFQPITLIPALLCTEDIFYQLLDGIPQLSEYAKDLQDFPPSTIPHPATHPAHPDLVQEDAARLSCHHMDLDLNYCSQNGEPFIGTRVVIRTLLQKPALKWIQGKSQHTLSAQSILHEAPLGFRLNQHHCQRNYPPRSKRSKEGTEEGFPKLRVLFWGTHNKDHGILGSHPKP